MAAAPCAVARGVAFGRHIRRRYRHTETIFECARREAQMHAAVDDFNASKDNDDDN
jgi:hypothetical protein